MRRKLVGAVLFLCAGFLAFESVGLARTDNPEHVKQLRATGACEGCDLRGAFLDAIILENGSLRRADLTGASLYKADLRGADLTGALLNETKLTGANLKGAKGALLAAAITDERTTCPDVSAGPCR